MQHKKVDAFTLSEMLVVLVVASLVISMTFMVLNLVQKQVTSIRKNFSTQQQIQLLERLLQQDFNTYTIRYNQTKDMLELTNEIDTITYIFNDEYVLRQTDTIRVKILNKAVFLDGELITSGFTDAITINTEQLYNTNKIFVYQHKDASHYLNN